MDPYWNFVDAYAEGWNAGYDNLPFDCPYPEGMQKYTEWQDGYNDGWRNS